MLGGSTLYFKEGFLLSLVSRSQIFVLSADGLVVRQDLGLQRVLKSLKGFRGDS